MSALCTLTSPILTVVDSYQMPSSAHGVLGVEDTIVLGRHLFALGNIARSCHGYLHTCVMGVGVTNTVHDGGPTSILRQIMALWYRRLILENGFDCTFYKSIRERKSDHRRSLAGSRPRYGDANGP